MVVSISDCSHQFSIDLAQATAKVNDPSSTGFKGGRILTVCGFAFFTSSFPKVRQTFVSQETMQKGDLAEENCSEHARDGQNNSDTKDLIAL